MEFRATAIGRGKDEAAKALSVKHKPMNVSDGEALARELLAGRDVQVVSLECPKRGRK